LQIPPQPSDAPQDLPLQLGWHVHCPWSHVCPDGHVPLSQVLPQPSGSPHFLPLQLGWHLHCPWSHACPDGHVPLSHVPPQPSGSPHFLPLQLGRQHSQAMLLLTQTCPDCGHPLHTLPQPSATPQPFWTQSAWQVHLPLVQTCPVGQSPLPLRHLPPQPSEPPQVVQLVVQHLPAVQTWPEPHSAFPVSHVPPQPSGPPQVVHFASHFGGGGTVGGEPPDSEQESLQAPLTQTCPAAQLTLAQGFAAHFPSRHVWPVGQETSLQRSGGTHEMLETSPGLEQVAPLGWRSWHCPSPFRQYLPAGHETLLHGTWKQPVMQVPSTQV
jgi:hypothetical protein